MTIEVIVSHWGGDRICWRALLLNVLFEHLPPDDPAIDIALRVHAHAFGAAVILGGRFHVFDEVFHRAVFGAPDADALLPTGLILSPRFGIGHVHGVILRDEDAARPCPLAPGVKIAAVLVEDLNPVISAVADKQAASRIEGD